MKNNTKYLETFRLENLTATRELAILCGVGIFYLLLHVIQTQRIAGSSSRTFDNFDKGRGNMDISQVIFHLRDKNPAMVKAWNEEFAPYSTTVKVHTRR